MEGVGFQELGLRQTGIFQGNILICENDDCRVLRFFFPNPLLRIRSRGYWILVSSVLLLLWNTGQKPSDFFPGCLICDKMITQWEESALKALARERVGGHEFMNQSPIAPNWAHCCSRVFLAMTIRLNIFLHSSRLWMGGSQVLESTNPFIHSHL